MLISDIITSSLKGMRRNLMRSILTTLGIMIGVGSVVLMISVGSSFQEYIKNQMEGFSGSTIEVHPKGLEEFGKDPNTITVADFEAIRRLTTVKNAAPVIFIRERAKFERENVAPMVMGTTKDIFPNWSLELASGRLLNESDVSGASSVAVLGSETADDLFGDSNPIGKRIALGSAKLTVVGVLQSLGSGLTSSLDAHVYIPITLARSISGNTSTVDYISLQSSGNVELTKQDITALLRQRHSIKNPDNDLGKDDFIVRSFEQAMGVVNTVLSSLTLFIGLIAGISLLVGGIGIMNIMFVTVSERTPEIGLRKALGARQSDILIQFLVEAVLLTVTGGAIGVVGAVSIGYLLSLVASSLLEGFRYSIPIYALLMAIGMAAGVGLIFGIYPAKRAAALDPIEALRRE